jgi:hypothetical protein
MIEEESDRALLFSEDGKELWKSSSKRLTLQVPSHNRSLLPLPGMQTKNNLNCLKSFRTSFHQKDPT